MRGGIDLSTEDKKEKMVAEVKEQLEKFSDEELKNELKRRAESDELIKEENLNEEI